MITGALIFGTPVYGAGQEENALSGEGQISRPREDTSESADNPFLTEEPTNNTYGYYTIMGQTTVSAQDMALHFYNQNLEYPSAVLGQGGASDIETFCEILVEEAQAENVRGEVVFEQAMLETGWLQFQGDCSAGQYNFAGLGATGNGEAGISFADVRTGLRAQVQHLKAYASAEELNQECVDERFDMVVRESAPYVEWLGIQENPYGGGWAAGKDYGYKLRTLLGELTGTEYIWPETISETVQGGSPN